MQNAGAQRSSCLTPTTTTSEGRRRRSPLPLHAHHACQERLCPWSSLRRRSLALALATTSAVHLPRRRRGACVRCRLDRRLQQQAQAMGQVRGKRRGHLHLLPLRADQRTRESGGRPSGQRRPPAPAVLLVLSVVESWY